MDSFSCKESLTVGQKTYNYMSLPKAMQSELGDLSRLPYSLKVLLENLLRFEDGTSVQKKDIAALGQWLANKSHSHEVAYRPARVLLQDFTGVPAVVDLAAMREAMKSLGGDPQKINPMVPVDLVIDHSVMVDHFGDADAFKANVDLEFQRNGERYELLRWAQKSFDNFSVVPPGTGICHQVNLEYLGKVVFATDASKDKQSKDSEAWVYPDTVVGTDSHTTMINGLSILGWGVGGIEAEAAMLAQPISMMIPDVVGMRLTGKMPEGATATDLVLMVTQILRKQGVVGKFVEFFGDGLENLALADRATIANMAPEYGATCGFFPIDQATIDYLKFTGRDDHQVQLVEAYAKAQGMWHDPSHEPVFTETVELNLADIKPCIAGPKRPQDRIALTDAASTFQSHLASEFKVTETGKTAEVSGSDFEISHGSVVIAAITSCTNTSNPAVLVTAGLIAKKALEKGLKVKPWVKTSFAPGSQVVTDYLKTAGLQDCLDELGFNLVGYGCTTCIGNSGPLPDNIREAIEKNDIVASAVLSGNRNFEGRVSPSTKANYLASPPLVVAYALAGNVNIDITTQALGQNEQGEDVFLKDLWPSNAEIIATVAAALTPQMFKSRYADVFNGTEQWKSVKATKGFTFSWDKQSTYVANPPFFEGMTAKPKPAEDVVNARPLAVFGDNVTTDHISPAGSIKADSSAGEYLQHCGVKVRDFNSFGSRRGNHEVMMRGTFANIRIRNEMVPGTEGGVTVHHPSGIQMTIYDAAMSYKKESVPLVVIGGKEYGMGSSRDWAAKGTHLLGVRAVIAESFERIHRSNLIGMGVIPLEFEQGCSRKSLGIDGSETFSIGGVSEFKPRQNVQVKMQRHQGESETFQCRLRIDTEDELSYYNQGGILQHVIRKLVGEA